MTRFVLACLRVVMLCISFFFSTLAAALFVTFSLFLGADVSWLEEDPLVAAGSLGFTLSVWLTIGWSLFLPFIGLVTIAEFTRLTGLLANLLMGGLCALIFLVLFISPENLDVPYSETEVWLTALAAGFVGGFTHWLIAGHRAGRWLGPQQHIS